jgi:YHS domain-containing protein
MMNRWLPAFALTAVLGWTSGDGLAQNAHAAKATQSGEKSKGVAEPPARPALPLCPVMGEPIDFNVRTMTADGPVYFCCRPCVTKFEKDPAKYADGVAEQRQALKKMEHIQVTCPVTGKPIDGKTFIESDGQKIGFCCKDCVPKYEANPAKYKANLEAAYTYQTRCPVTGEKIDPTVYVDLATGERIYLCCKACGPKLMQDPAKYDPRLEEQGIRLDLNKLKTQPHGAGHAQPTGQKDTARP